MESQLAEIIAWIEPRALFLALLLPPLIRVVGHWIPEEIFMVAIGVLAARSDSPAAATALLGAVLAGQLATDQIVYLGGRWLRPRLTRFPRIAGRLELVTGHLTASPHALFGLVPARVLPLGRGAWLAGCGVVDIPWPRFLAVDLLALLTHVAVWSGLGWWMAGDPERLAASAETGKLLGMWVIVLALTATAAVVLWRRRAAWQPATIRAFRQAGRHLRELTRLR